jgi:hypothetical protein
MRIIFDMWLSIPYDNDKAPLLTKTLYDRNGGEVWWHQGGLRDTKTAECCLPGANKKMSQIKMGEAAHENWYCITV